MAFPAPAPLFASGITSIWTDFKSVYDGKTPINRDPLGSFMNYWSYGSALPDIATIATAPGSISGQAFRHGDRTATGRNTMGSWDLPQLASVLDCEILMGVLIVQHQDGGSLAIPQGGNIFARRQTVSSSTYFVQGMGFDGASNVRDRENIAEFAPAGTLSSPNTMSSWDLNTWYWLRFRAEGDAYRLRRWLRASAEPATWDVVLPGGTLLTPGALGILASNREVSQQYFDFFSVSLDGRPAYGPGL
jgi:hypothetical protein